jgi:DNA-binding transcriptional regulator GbsR (MarR family)
VQYIEVVIKDNGIGIQKEAGSNKQHRSMAMDIFEKRRKLIQHKFNKDFKFEVSNLKDLDFNLSGVKVTLKIPVLDND